MFNRLFEPSFCRAQHTCRAEAASQRLESAYEGAQKVLLPTELIIHDSFAAASRWLAACKRFIDAAGAIA
jgi:hypothetical protein